MKSIFLNKVFKVILNECRMWSWAFLNLIPGRAGCITRGWIVRLSAKGRGCVSIDKDVDISPGLIRVGSDLLVSSRCSLHAYGNGVIEIGDRVSINTNTTIDASENGLIEIGDDVLIAQNVVIRASNHAFSELEVPIDAQGHSPGNIKIGNNVWIGANVVITPDVEIGDNVIVAAGAVVTKNIAESTVVGGVPAVVIKYRK